MPKETLIRGESSGATFIKEGQIDPHGLVRVHRVQSDDVPYYLKFPRYPEDRSSHKKLKREYEMHSALSHPNITPIILFDTTKDLISGLAVPFFIMPQRETDVKTRIDENPFIPISDIVAITTDIAGALSYVHKEGMFHLDLQVSNVLLNAQNGIHAELTDFEYAVYDGEKKHFRKATMPPELRKGTYVAASDQFEFARNIVYPMIFGSYSPGIFDPFYGHDTKSPLPQRRPFSERFPPNQITDSHRTLEAVAEKALQEQIPDRYASMAVLLDDLRSRTAGLREIQIA